CLCCYQCGAGVFFGPACILGIGFHFFQLDIVNDDWDLPAIHFVEVGKLIQVKYHMVGVVAYHVFEGTHDSACSETTVTQSCSLTSTVAPLLSFFWTQIPAGISDALCAAFIVLLVASQ